MGRVANILAVALTCGIVALAADFFRGVGLALHAEQYLAGLLAIAMPLLFLHVPADGGRKGRVGPIPSYHLPAAARRPAPRGPAAHPRPRASDRHGGVLRACHLRRRAAGRIRGALDSAR